MWRLMTTWILGSTCILALLCGCSRDEGEGEQCGYRHFKYRDVHVAAGGNWPCLADGDTLHSLACDCLGCGDSLGCVYIFPVLYTGVDALTGETVKEWALIRGYMVGRGKVKDAEHIVVGEDTTFFTTGLDYWRGLIVQSLQPDTLTIYGLSYKPCGGGYYGCHQWTDSLHLTIIDTLSR